MRVKGGDGPASSEVSSVRRLRRFFYATRLTIAHDFARLGGRRGETVSEVQLRHARRSAHVPRLRRHVRRARTRVGAAKQRSRPIPTPRVVTRADTDLSTLA